MICFYIPSVLQLLRRSPKASFNVFQVLLPIKEQAIYPYSFVSVKEAYQLVLLNQSMRFIDLKEKSLLKVSQQAQYFQTSDTELNEKHSDAFQSLMSSSIQTIETLSIAIEFLSRVGSATA